MEITSASFAYPRVGEADRARVARALAGADSPAGAFVLSTCLRTEIAVPGDQTDLKQRLDELLGALPIDPEVREGEAAVEHLFRVAAGLESPIVGEVEVLVQFRQALADLRSGSAPEGSFLKLLELAVAAGRDARQSMPPSPHDTMAAVAAQVVGSAPKVAVVGSGTMARSVVESLASLPAPPKVLVLTREPTRVELGGVEILSLDALSSVLAELPVVVSATAASKRLLDAQQVGEALTGRYRPLLLVDMAMPPDFDPPADGPIRYVGIDELARLASRRLRTTEAEDQITRAAAEAHHAVTSGGLAGPVIAALLADADQVVDRTVERFSGRLSDDADREVLRQTAHTVARTILNRPVSALRSTRDPDTIEVISAVFHDG